MATYFGYVEREADSYVNWADVGRNMSATIDNIQRVRDEKKALIEKAYREDLDYIQANPSGENKSLREKSIEFANSAAENLKLKYSQLKQGKLNVQDFVAFRQNITDDTENLYGTLNKMQEEYKRKMDRAKAGDSQLLERRNMELLEQYDMSKTDLFVNGLTGSVTIGLMEEVEENGQKVRRLTKDPNKYISVNQYKAAVTEDYNNYDPLPALAGWVEQHGEVINSLRTLGSELQVGSILEITDITGQALVEKMTALGKSEAEIKIAQKAVDDWKAAKETFFKSELANDYNALAILTDQRKFNKDGKQYIPTYNKDDLKKGKEYIFIDRNNVGGSVPTFEKHHIDEALEYLDLLTRPLLDKKVKESTYQEPRPERAYGQFNERVYEEGLKDKEIRADAQLLGEMYYGTPSQMASALDWVKSKPKVFDVNNSYYNDATGELIITPLDQPPIVTKLYDVDAQGNIIGEYTGKDKISSKDFVTRILGYVHPSKNPAIFRDMVPDRPVGAQPVTGEKAKKQQRLKDIYAEYDKENKKMAPDQVKIRQLENEREKLEKELGGAYIKKGQGTGGKTGGGKMENY